jgi:hypothetical protein
MHSAASPTSPLPFLPDRPQACLLARPEVEHHADPSRHQVTPIVHQPRRTTVNTPDNPQVRISLFAGDSERGRRTATLLPCIHTAEVAGSNPASPTPKVPASGRKREALNFQIGGFLLQLYCNANLRELAQGFLKGLRGLLLSFERHRPFAPSSSASTGLAESRQIRRAARPPTPPTKAGSVVPAQGGAGR